jgi:pimeloyl-ACP methyl ester carboxylesterase
MQGVDDAYGSMRHIDDLRTAGTVQREVLKDCGHAPYREQAVVSLELVKEFLKDGP